MNSTLVFVIIIVAMAMCANIIQTWLKQKKRAPEKDQELEETLSKIDRLEERIQVLERIITENRFDLRNEIDTL
jgi:Na+-transporting methylmalonyl-CoA/oxaloacetate decarboxylase gamma subunit